MIDYYLKCKQVERLSTADVYIHRGYNLMEHQWMTGILFRHFASLEDVPYDINVWDIVLKHDLLEVESGDLQYTVKNYSETTKLSWETLEKELLKDHFKLNPYSDHGIKNSLTPLQYKLFKACDLLELMIFCLQEYELGNRNKGLIQVIKNCENIITKDFKKINKFIKDFKNKCGYVS